MPPKSRQYGQSLLSVEHLYALSRLLNPPWKASWSKWIRMFFSCRIHPARANVSCLLHPVAKWGIMGTQAY